MSFNHGEVLRNTDRARHVARNGGAIENPDLTGHAGAPGRGAFMILYLKIEDERIAAAKYHTVGCGPTIASGSMLTEMINGKSIAECRELTVENLIEALDGVPPDKLHCPALAIGALEGCAGALARSAEGTDLSERKMADQWLDGDEKTMGDRRFVRR